jgi:quinoprotein glucose dehydrogenase
VASCSAEDLWGTVDMEVFYGARHRKEQWTADFAERTDKREWRTLQIRRIRVIRVPFFGQIMTTHRLLFALACLLSVWAASGANAQSPPPAWAEMFDQGEVDPRLKGISTPRGIKFEIVAEGAAVGSPLAMTFDERGTLFVLQAKTDKVPERLVALRDVDADGSFEKSDVVMSELAGRTSLLFDDGWFYLAGSGQVIRRRPHDAKLAGEFQAAAESKKGPPTSVTTDKQWIEQSLIRGLNTRPEDQTGGLSQGLDGSIYLSIGGTAIRAESWDGSKATVLGSGAIFRFQPDGSNVQEFARGFSTPMGAPAVDALGNHFQSDKTSAGSRLIHALEGGDYGWRSDFDPPRYDRPGTLPAMLQTSAVAPTNLLVYQGEAFPKIFQGLLLAADPEAHAVRAYVLQANGNSFAAAQQFDLIRSNEPAFRPTLAAGGPEGAIYLTDVRLKADSRIYRLTWSGNKTAPAIDVPPLAKREPKPTLSAAESLAVALAKPKSTAERAAALGAACRAWDKSVLDGCLQIFLDDQPDLQRLAADSLGDHAPDDAETQERIADAMEQKLLLGPLPVRRSIYIALGKLGTKLDSVPEWIFEASSVTPDVHTNRYLFEGHVRAAETPKGWATELMLGNLEVALFDPNPEPEERQRLKKFVVATAEAMRTRELADFLDKTIRDETDYFSKLDGPLQARLLTAYQNVLVEPAIHADAVALWLEKHPASAPEVQLAAWQTLAKVGTSKPELTAGLAKTLLASGKFDPTLKPSVTAALERHRVEGKRGEIDALLEVVKRAAEKPQ